jgi:hypothetical protein
MPDLSDRELVLEFESLGDNCELGLVQRRVGAEPLGLLRFAGVPLRHLLRALAARFEGLADPAHVRIQPENGEYMVKLTLYDFIYHADALVGQADPVVLHHQQSRVLSFLADKLLADLQAASKIMVFRQNEPLLAGDLIDLRLALSRLGPSTLLWVQPARPGHPPGSVDRIDDRLLAGYVSRLAKRESVPDLDLASWLSMLRRAYALVRAKPLSPIASLGEAAPPILVPPPEPQAEAAVQLHFGTGGNAQRSTGYGWSAPENGFTWAIGPRSLLILEPPRQADEYWLEMDVIPYMVPVALPGQRLEVAVNGEIVQVFDPVARGRIACLVPGRLVNGQKRVELVLGHPLAAKPSDVAGENDVRPLAVAFRSLSFSAAQSG